LSDRYKDVNLAEPDLIMGLHKDIERDTQADGIQDTREVDIEVFIRKAFTTDPRLGCELLFRRYYTNLCNHAIRFVHSKEVAEDIVSDVFAVFWQKRTYEIIEISYRSYLYKAVRHRAYNHLKLELENSDSIEQASEVSAIEQLPDEILHYEELHQKIDRIIQQLPPQCRKAYLLKRVEGKKYDEIAEEMKITQKAVEALVSRALVKLRTGLQEFWYMLILLIMLNAVA